MVDQSILIFAFGNPSRGDDALGPSLIDALQEQGIKQACGNYPVKYLTDFQIQVEHVLDMQHCQRVLLVDAHQQLDQPFNFYSVQEQLQTSYTTHGMNAETLLFTYRQILAENTPPTSMLAIQGNDFTLGNPLSEIAQQNLQEAALFCRTILQSDDFEHWDQQLIEFAKHRT